MNSGVILVDLMPRTHVTDGGPAGSWWTVAQVTDDGVTAAASYLLYVNTDKWNLGEIRARMFGVKSEDLVEAVQVAAASGAATIGAGRREAARTLSVSLVVGLLVLALGGGGALATVMALLCCRQARRNDSSARIPAGSSTVVSQALWEQMQDKPRISQDLGTPAARKEQSPRVLCAYRRAMLATGASGLLPAQNDSVDCFSKSDWSVGSRCLTLGESKLATARLGRGVPTATN